MSQSRQSNATAAAPTAGTSPEADTLVEAYAEDLMDEIFDDVDRILAGDESAIYAEATATSASASLFTAEAVMVPAMIVPFMGTPTVEAKSASPIPETDDDTHDTSGKTTTRHQNSPKRPWRKFLLGALCLSALAGVGVWWMRQQPALLTPTATAPVTPSAPPVSPEVAFGDYLQRSLKVIGGERSAQIETQGSDVVATAPTNTPANTQSNRQARGVIERVFVPMLQPGAGVQRTAPTTTTGVTSGDTSSNSANARASLPVPNLTNRQSSQSSDSDTTVPNIAVADTYELVGVLELGDRSAALFEIDGSSQRVYIGETIGGSGWSIVSISNEEVVVRRNGEVRSIYIGQRF